MTLKCYECSKVLELQGIGMPFAATLARRQGWERIISVWFCPDCK